ncbi:MAG: hypothetical protein JWL90_2864 [Chthoniobacteraceae bacterium]|nr:hypothetical protein [Chthoniobacteraceae bacterium]
MTAGKIRKRKMEFLSSIEINYGCRKMFAELYRACSQTRILFIYSKAKSSF